MKKWIHAASIPDQVKKIREAQNALNKYDKEKVDYVRQCQDDIVKAISDRYLHEDDDYPIGSTLSEIKRDYLVGAIEDDLMTEDEFEDILDLLDIISIEYAAPYA